MLPRSISLFAASAAICSLALMVFGRTSGAMELLGEADPKVEEPVGKAPKVVNMVADPLTISLSAGGEQNFSIDFGPKLAGAKYIVAGSRRGTVPGTLYGIVNVPLNFDKYSDTLLRSMGKPKFSSFSGKLDGKGRASATLSVPVSVAPELVGMVVYHAAIALDAKTGEVLKASNAVELVLMP